MITLSNSQKKFIRDIHKYDLVFATGAAGTGKTHIACSEALNYIKKPNIDKIIITRPLVATEEIGFLPGNLDEKIEPFLEPIIQVLKDVYDRKSINQLISTEKIQVLPLAHARGVTLKNSYIILDEAQNTTIAQMKMFLTRFGPNIKCAIVGDLKQSDLVDQENGLQWALKTLKECNLIGHTQFSGEEVVRSALVKEIMRHIYAKKKKNT